MPSHNLSITSNENTLKVLPNNSEAEQSLLGSLLLSNLLYEKVSEFLRPDHFSTTVNGKIYEAMGTLIERGEVADPITLKGFFEDIDELSSVGGAGYLVQLASSVVSTHSVYDYGRLIYDLFLRRQLISIGDELINDASKFSVDQDATSQIEKTESKLFELANSGQLDRGFVSFEGALKLAVQSAESSYNKDSHVSGITTGLIDLDKWLGGLHQSDLVVLAGRPSMGKTALATNIAYNAAVASLKDKGGGGKVAFFSLEMSVEQLATRLLAQECEIPSDRIRRGEIRSSDFSRFVETSRALSKIPLFIDDTPALTVATLRMRARRLKRKYGLDLIVVDYLQLLQPSIGKRNDNRVQEISEITRMLKAVAKELNVPILALSQLSRAVEQRDDKRPQLADLRESGSIEQDADVVMFIYREEYYESRKEPQRGTDKHLSWQDHMAKIYNSAEVIIAKQRHGPIGTIRLFYDGKLTKFDNLSNT